MVLTIVVLKPNNSVKDKRTSLKTDKENSLCGEERKMGEVPEVKGSMPLVSLDEWRAIVEKRAFLITQVESFKRVGDSIIFKISDNPRVAFNKASRRVFELEEKGIWRWPAGGCATIAKLNGHNVLLSALRDKGAPSYAGHDTVASGLGGSWEEILYPLRTALREGVEEISVVIGDKIVCPNLDIDPFGFSLEFRHIIEENKKLYEATKNCFLDSRKCRLLPLPGESNIIVLWKGWEARCRALVSFDKGTNGIDLLVALLLPLEDVNLEDIAVFDGEEVGGNVLNRVINAYELDGFCPTGRIIASWKSGKRIEHPKECWPYPMTPIMKDAVEALKKI